MEVLLFGCTALYLRSMFAYTNTYSVEGQTGLVGDTYIKYGGGNTE